MVTRIVLGLAAVLAFASQGCVAIGWWAEGSGDSEPPAVFGNDPAFATCSFDANPPSSTAGPSCVGLDNYVAYHCTDQVLLDQPSHDFGCKTAGPNLPHEICCPSP